MYSKRKPVASHLNNKIRLMGIEEYLEETWKEREREEASENIGRLLAFLIKRKNRHA